MSAPVKHWVIWLCVAFVLVDIAIAAWLGITIWRDRQQAVQPLNELLPPPTEMTQEEEKQWRIQTLGEAHRLVHLFSEPEVKNGSVSIMLSNSEECCYAVRMELMHLDSHMVIAQTGLIDPGWRVETVPLTYQLRKGTHHCLAQLFFHDPASGALLGKTARQVLLNVNQ